MISGKNKIKNWDQFLYESVENNKDIDFIYQKFDGLSDIGNKDEYSKYLDYIFPDSKVKGIYYHVSPNKFTEFRDPSNTGLSHIWFSETPLEGGQYGKNIYPVILDIRNPLSEDEPNYRQELKGYESPINPEWRNSFSGELPKFKYDGTIRISRVDPGRSITVRSPKQIHILGSKEDLEGFTRFIKNR
jgi:hypothetical protein